MRWMGLLLALGMALAQATPYYERCSKLYGQGALEAAEATCELALVADPNHGPTQLLLTRIYLEKGDLEKAASLLERLPETPETRRLKARLLLGKGRAEEAPPLLQGDPTPEARLLRAQALYRMGRLEEAEGELLAETPSPEGRLLLAEIKTRLRNPQEALSVLGNTPKEVLLKARITLYQGRAKEAVPVLEALIPSLEGKAYREALGLLALAYYAAGDWVRGGVALAQFSQVESLPGLFLKKAWPWLLLLILFLALLLFAESRIEPTRTVEVVEDPIPGPGSLLGALFLLFLTAFALSAWIGHLRYGTYLAFFLPYPRETLLPLFYLLYGVLSLIYLSLRFSQRLPQILGNPKAWLEGLWVGPLLLLLLFLYGALRMSLDLPGLYQSLWTFLGLALLEPFFRGFTPWVLEARYKGLSPYLSALLYALALPGPTFYFLLAGGVLLWVRGRTQGVLAGSVGFVLAGILLLLLPKPLVRTRL